MCDLNTKIVQKKATTRRIIVISVIKKLHFEPDLMTSKSFDMII